MQALFVKYFQKAKKPKKTLKRAEKRWKFATICDHKCTQIYWFSTKTQYLQFKKVINTTCNIPLYRLYVCDKPSLASTREGQFYAFTFDFFLIFTRVECCCRCAESSGTGFHPLLAGVQIISRAWSLSRSLTGAYEVCGHTLLGKASNRADAAFEKLCELVSGQQLCRINSILCVFTCGHISNVTLLHTLNLFLPLFSSCDCALKKISCTKRPYTGSITSTKTPLPGVWDHTPARNHLHNLSSTRISSCYVFSYIGSEPYSRGCEDCTLFPMNVIRPVWIYSPTILRIRRQAPPAAPSRWSWGSLPVNRDIDHQIDRTTSIFPTLSNPSLYRTELVLGCVNSNTLRRVFSCTLSPCGQGEAYCCSWSHYASSHRLRLVQ